MNTFFDTLKSRNKPLYYFEFVCLICAIGCLVLTRVTHTDVLGTNAWFKPFKFFLSTTIFSGRWPGIWAI